ncbi:23S rRNA (adenine(2503)-C(2))-methyltransferase RlmN [Chlorobium phaeobacteroides]|jgi:23S rRNA (adenine2503-C2)-methyltransferase|uniref:Probable dual-specificity RNA methyltransferase RlmN n=1 Tax=Chlorobium phaeobacteroides (strain DSM 266 / SMG 266 / 2430) TaxID=290317 RepID=RLMN_CHLPD|nr:23S rRNA (adenine(2503)-C(2))-methyltransferase RlmN [Chlorobium phaeobacteroides]A1BGN4.1 RecName: Full=Probable dual-specificity RNA methyltransferase RlmN; AltName: Full=23S rRNA (adenine(2503)-C(2))-methyltransferase; AltName: Full=23S rRNA m2A2503 methyltransferase; AltName: Full=Ribosomal RNA large subunit methyltransferase N; AltName: Full=tRNA (adenine(37)-C(2))-methyltransferase; AltName: Full=tRNA m2A37 methyltransferase [Chlorobium phaeobacteroides DSM 266]ABL65561.1 23S rRNA m(2)A-
MQTRLSNIKHLSRQELRQAIANLGEPAYRTRQIHQWIFSHRAATFEEMTTISLELRNKLADQFRIGFPILADCQQDGSANDPFSTVKLLLELDDNEKIETVLIPSENRMTACVSSQVGCPLQCRFCASGQTGFKRNLSADEIIDQVFSLNDFIRTKHESNEITNIVFMGMGEPLLNFENLKESIEVLSDQSYKFNLPQRKITISTVGIIPGINELGKSGLKTKLAISLHSASQETRESLIPVASEFSLTQLRKTLSEYTSQTGEPVTLVYMLLKGINDSVEDARLLVKFSRSFLCKINLIDYNSIINMKFKPVFNETKDMFIQHILDAGIHVTVRKSHGASINAACGQLAAKGTQKAENRNNL